MMDVGFDPERAWVLNPQVALRPESFGALAYHFGTRRLSFLKDPGLVRVVEQLAEHKTGAKAIAASGVTRAQEPAIERALSTLVETGMIIERRSE
jgi:putative mycofactocin binding protein MftB